MGMTREDVLRELELLPVWQLRVPIESPVTVLQVIALAAHPLASYPSFYTHNAKPIKIASSRPVLDMF